MIEKAFSLEERVAVVTGAGSGQGLEIAKLLAARGASIVAVDINEKSCSETVEGLKGKGSKAIGIATDVSDAKQVDQMVEEALRVFKRIDILINCAGIMKFGPLADTDQAAWDRIMAVNLRGQFLCASSVLPIMRKQKSGRIINIASIAGRTGGATVSAVYSASKAGVISLTKSLAKEGAPCGILVNTISPGIVDTPMMHGHEKTIEPLKAQIPLGRFARPEEIAYAALFLCSGFADYITGQNLHVNGGLLMSD